MTYSVFFLSSIVIAGCLLQSISGYIADSRIQMDPDKPAYMQEQYHQIVQEDPAKKQNSMLQKYPIIQQDPDKSEQPSQDVFLLNLGKKLADEQNMHNSEAKQQENKTETGKIAQNSNVWPDGLYALLQPTQGCPNYGNGWRSGYRYHDTEDSRNNNQFSNGIAGRIQGYYSSNILQYYCVKEISQGNGVTWPHGSYCIAKGRASCPSLGFNSGSIFWDDEDSGNSNQRHGHLPDGEYGRNTRINYCCRNDGSAFNAITLPRSMPFVLYRYGGACQSVHGMAVIEDYVRFDDEDSGNIDSCSGQHPDDDGCSSNHFMYLCYYY